MLYSQDLARLSVSIAIPIPKIINATPQTSVLVFELFDLALLTVDLRDQVLYEIVDIVLVIRESSWDFVHDFHDGVQVCLVKWLLFR